MNHPQNQQPGGGFRLAELLICGFAMVLGLIYLNTTWIPLGVLMPVYAVFFTALPVLRIFEAKSRENVGFLTLLPAVCYLLLSLVVIGATVLYFVKF